MENANIQKRTTNYKIITDHLEDCLENILTETKLLIGTNHPGYKLLTAERTTSTYTISMLICMCVILFIGVCVFLFVSCFQTLFRRGGSTPRVHLVTYQSTLKSPIQASVPNARRMLTLQTCMHI